MIYWFHNEDQPVVLLWVFAKNAASDLTPQQRATLMREIDATMSDHGERE